jgi:hypothetical protein
MLSPRPYRAALSLDAALDELVGGAETQFDPAVVQALASIPRARLTEIGRYYGARRPTAPATAPQGPPREPLAIALSEPVDVAGTVCEFPAGADADEPDVSGPSERTPAGALDEAGGDEARSDRLRVTEEETDRDAPPPRACERDQPFLVVARGHQDLLEELRAVLGDAMGPIQMIEDRRHDQTILPREGRQGTPHADWEIDSETKA